jgi:hypothetical protein
MIFVALGLLAALLFALAKVFDNAPWSSLAEYGEYVDWQTRYLKIGVIAGRLVGGIAFVASYWYCIDTYGYLLGFGLGWLPSAILFNVTHWVVVYVWPLLFVGVAGVALAIAAYS